MNEKDGRGQGGKCNSGKEKLTEGRGLKNGTKGTRLAEQYKVL